MKGNELNKSDIKERGKSKSLLGKMVQQIMETLPGSVESPDVVGNHGFVQSLHLQRGVTFARGAQQEFFSVGAEKEQR